MRKHNQVHTLGAPHYKAHFRLLRKLKDFKCALGPKNTVVALICSQAIICLPREKTCNRMLRHRAVYGDNCEVV